MLSILFLKINLKKQALQIMFMMMMKWLVCETVKVNNDMIYILILYTIYKLKCMIYLFVLRHIIKYILIFSTYEHF